MSRRMHFALLAATLALLLPGGHSAASPRPSPHLAWVKPASGSACPGDVVFVVGSTVRSFGIPGPEPAKLAALLELWDLTAGVTRDFSAAPDPAKPSELLVTPKGPLSAGGEYGLRVQPGGAWEAGEISRHFVGARPRVARLHFKGGRTLYIDFSEPLDPVLVAAAITLTNTVTGAVTKPTLAGSDPDGRRLTFEIDSSTIDVRVPHELTIAKTAADPPGLDGGFAMPRGPAADFVLALTPTDLDVFVNGAGRLGYLQFDCHRNKDWYDEATQRAVATTESCRRSGSPPTAGGGGCGVGGGASGGSRSFAVLLLLALLGGSSGFRRVRSR